MLNKPSLCKLQYLLALLDLYRPSHLHSPLLAPLSPHTTPIQLPPRTPTTAGSPSIPAARGSAFTEKILLSTLDVVLCALVDRPRNVRMFEAAGGLGAVVRVLKDKSVPHKVR